MIPYPALLVIEIINHKFHDAMSKIGLGLAALGRPEYINIRSEASIDQSITAFEKNTFKVLDLAYKLGVRHFDTAPSYGKGEAFLLHWNQLHHHPDTKLSTKWGYTYVADWELGYQGAHEIKEHSLKKLKEQWKVSKQLLPALKIHSRRIGRWEFKMCLFIEL